jgi:hypothetical protein
MALRVTRASDHTVTGLDPVRYCSIQDVLDELANVALDDDGNVLGALVDEASRTRKLEQEIAAARLWIEKKAGHDFEKHAEVAVYLNGTGGDVLELATRGFVPLLDISDLLVNGESLTLNEDFSADSQGRMDHFSETPQWYAHKRHHGTLFPRGPQNVSAKLTWGYASYPEDIVGAQAKKVVAELLRIAQRGDSAGGPEVGGGVGQIWFGNDLRVSVATKGRYADMIAELEADAKKVCYMYAIPKVRGAGVGRY